MTVKISSVLDVSLFVFTLRNLVGAITFIVVTDIFFRNWKTILASLYESQWFETNKLEILCRNLLIKIKIKKLSYNKKFNYINKKWTHLLKY